MTDTIQDGQKRHVPIIFLGGPIKYWWTCWDSYTHRKYLRHREHVRRTLIEAGYLTYAPWDAIKGSWDPRAQQINLWAISNSDLFLNLTPPGIPAPETDEEEKWAAAQGILTTRARPALVPQDLLDYLVEAIGPGVPYE